MRPPRVLARSFPLIPAIATVHDSVQLLGFDLCCSLTLIHSLYGFCSSGQSFAAGFLQIPRHQGHPCLWLYPSHCRADSGLSPVRTCARRAHSKKGLLESSRPLAYVGIYFLAVVSTSAFSLGSRIFSRIATIAAGTMPEPPKISWMAWGA